MTARTHQAIVHMDRPVLRPSEIYKSYLTLTLIEKPSPERPGLKDRVAYSDNRHASLLRFFLRMVLTKRVARERLVVK